MSTKAYRRLLCIGRVVPSLGALKSSLSLSIPQRKHPYSRETLIHTSALCVTACFQLFRLATDTQNFRVVLLSSRIKTFCWVSEFQLERVEFPFSNISLVVYWFRPATNVSLPVVDLADHGFDPAPVQREGRSEDRLFAREGGSCGGRLAGATMPSFCC